MAISRLVAVLFAGLSIASPQAHAGWREDIGTFRIGMVSPSGSTASIEGADAIAAGFAAALAMPVEIFPARDYAVLVDAQASGRIQYAIHTATSYAAASLLCSCVEPVVSPVAEDSAFGIRAALVARPDGPSTAEAATSARVAIGPSDSVTGYLLPLAEFRPGGATLDGSEPFLVPMSSAEQAEAALVAGNVDAMFGFVGATDDPAFASGGTPERLKRLGLADPRILWVSPRLRNGPHAVLSTLAGEAKTILADYLVDLRAADPERFELVERRFGGGFVRVQAEDYASALALVRGLGRPADE